MVRVRVLVKDILVAVVGAVDHQLVVLVLLLVALVVVEMEEMLMQQLDMML